MSYFRTTFLLSFLLGVFATALAVAEAPSCFQELERNFFKDTIVNEALSLHNVWQSNWNLINYELKRNVKRVPDIVERRARQLNPNPLGSPYLPEEAAELLKQILLEVFMETLSIFHLNNVGQAEEMFQYIFQKQTAKWEACFPVTKRN